MQFNDVARPDDWWKHGLNLFTEIYKAEGFRPVDIQVSQMQVFDIMLMAYGCPFPNHSAIYVGKGHIIQHLHGKLSNRDNIRSHHRDGLLAIVRHPDIIIKPLPVQKLNLVDMLSPHWKAKLSQEYNGEISEQEIKGKIRELGEECAAAAAKSSQSPGV